MGERVGGTCAMASIVWSHIPKEKRKGACTDKKSKAVTISIPTSFIN